MFNKNVSPQHLLFDRISQIGLRGHTASCQDGPEVSLLLEVGQEVFQYLCKLHNSGHLKRAAPEQGDVIAMMHKMYMTPELLHVCQATRRQQSKLIGSGAYGKAWVLDFNNRTYVVKVAHIPSKILQSQDRERKSIGELFLPIAQAMEHWQLNEETLPPMEHLATCTSYAVLPVYRGNKGRKWVKGLDLMLVTKARTGNGHCVTQLAHAKSQLGPGSPYRLLPLGQLLGAMSEVATGLGGLHMRGILHADIKAGNLLMDVVGGRVVNGQLADLGTAGMVVDGKAFRYSSVSTTQPVVQKPHEDQDGLYVVDRGSDVWTLMLTLLSVLLYDAPLLELHTCTFETKDYRAYLTRARQDASQGLCQLKAWVEGVEALDVCSREFFSDLLLSQQWLDLKQGLAFLQTPQGCRHKVGLLLLFGGDPNSDQPLQVTPSIDVVVAVQRVGSLLGAGRQTAAVQQVLVQVLAFIAKGLVPGNNLEEEDGLKKDAAPPEQHEFTAKEVAERTAGWAQEVAVLMGPQWNEEWEGEGMLAVDNVVFPYSEQDSKETEAERETWSMSLTQWHTRASGSHPCTQLTASLDDYHLQEGQEPEEIRMGEEGSGEGGEETEWGEEGGQAKDLQMGGDLLTAMALSAQAAREMQVEVQCLGAGGKEGAAMPQQAGKGVWVMKGGSSSPPSVDNSIYTHTLLSTSPPACELGDRFEPTSKPVPHASSALCATSVCCVSSRTPPSYLPVSSLPLHETQTDREALFWEGACLDSRSSCSSCSRSSS